MSGIVDFVVCVSACVLTMILGIIMGVQLERDVRKRDAERESMIRKIKEEYGRTEQESNASTQGHADIRHDIQ